MEVALAPDGKRIAFTTLRQNADLWRLPVSPQTGLPTGAPSALVSTTREDSRGSWAPDGSAIAFNSDRGGEMNIWVQSLADGSTRQLTSGSGGDFRPSWSPDQKRIAFFSSRTGRPGIFAVDLASRAVTGLASGGSIAGSPFYSPDGARIAFQSDQSGRNELWVMKADGSEARQLTNLGVSGHFVRWTAAGDAIVFHAIGRQTLLSVPAAGGEPKEFATLAKGGAHLSFSPTSRASWTWSAIALSGLRRCAAASRRRSSPFPNRACASTTPSGPPTESGCSSTARTRKGATSGCCARPTDEAWRQA